MNWWWQRARGPAPAITNQVPVSVRELGFAAMFSPGAMVDFAGLAIDEAAALNLSAVFRAVSLVTGTLASLPLNTWQDNGSGARKRVASVFDDPDGPDGQTQFEWTETYFAHLMIHGKAGALKIRNQGGSVVRLPLVHPSMFNVVEPTRDEYPVGGYWFDVQLDNGEFKRLDGEDFWWTPTLTMNGFTGLGLLQVARGSLATTQAGDQAASSILNTGAQISGLATPDDDEDITGDVPEIRRQLDNAVRGPDKAGSIALVNRRLKFTPWTMTAVDAQLLQSRQFQIEEVSRWSGVPPHLLMQTDKQTSWGTGVEEQNRALGRTVLNPWACRAEGRGSRLLARPRTLEIDFSGLERPSPDREIELLLKQTGGKPILTQNEAREKLGLAPVPDGNVLNPAPAPAPEPVEDDPAGDPEGDPNADA